MEIVVGSLPEKITYIAIEKVRTTNIAKTAIIIKTAALNISAI